jgi:hypothetical protein
MTLSSLPDPSSPEQQLLAIAERWHLPIKRLGRESLHALADRLSFAIEHQIARQLLDLEEIATLDLDEEQQP